MTKSPAKNIIRYKNLGARIEERRAADFYDNTQLLPDKNVKIKTFYFMVRRINCKCLANV